MMDGAFRFEHAGDTDRGCVRTSNEDNYLMKPEIGLWLVADGMGGHDYGELASASIVEHVASVGRPSSASDLRARVVDRLINANAHIMHISSQLNGATIGSTFVALMVYDRQFACLWSGDSRIYLVRGGQLSQVTRDHTEVQALRDRGLITEEEARNWPRKNVITHAVGVADELFYDVESGYLESGDTFVLCSDGLTAHVADEEILDIVYGRRAAEAVEMLKQLTLSRGAVDNTTIIVVQVRGASSTVPASNLTHQPA